MASHAPRTSSDHPSHEQESPGLLTLTCGEQPEIDLEIKRSHFLARACRTDSTKEARDFIARVRSIHPDARHHCSAFTITDLTQGLEPLPHPTERSNDDGEPSGTAGQPMLETLRGTRLANTTVVVARYFGGTLLGTGGLVRAYSDATAQALARASRVLVTRRHLWDVRVPVAQVSRLEADLRSRGDTGSGAVRVEETIWGPTHAVLMLSSGSSDPTRLHGLLAALAQGEAVPEPAGSRLTEVPVRPSSA